MVLIGSKLITNSNVGWCYSSYLLSAHTTSPGTAVFTVAMSSRIIQCTAHLSVPGWLLLSLGAPTRAMLLREFLSTIWCWATL